MIKHALMLVLLISSVAYAQEETKKQDSNPMPVVTLSDPPDIKLGTEYQFWMNEGEKSPYSGILLNPEATTFIISEYLAQRARAEAALEKQRAADFALYQLDVGRLQVELATTQEKSELRLNSKDSEIKRLRKINRDLSDNKPGFWDNLLLFGGTAAGGVLVGIVGGLLLTR